MGVAGFMTTGDGISRVGFVPIIGVRLGGGRVWRGVGVVSGVNEPSRSPSDRAPITIATTAKAASIPTTPLRMVFISPG